MSVRQEQLDHLVEENDELHKRVSHLENEEEELQRLNNNLIDEKEHLAKEKALLASRLAEAEQSLADARHQMHVAEDALHEYENDQAEGESEGDVDRRMSVTDRVIEAHRRNSRGGRRKTSIMYGQDVEIEESQAKIYDLEDKLKTVTEELDAFKGIKEKHDRLDRVRLEEDMEQCRVKAAFEEQMKSFEAENRKLRETNTDLQGELQAAKDEMERQIHSAFAVADDSSGHTGEVTPVLNPRNSFFSLSQQLDIHAAVSCAGSEPAESRVPSDDGEEELEEMRTENEQLKHDHRTARIELTQALSQKEAVEGECSTLRRQVAQLQSISASNERLRVTCAGQHAELARLLGECAKYRARSASAEKHPRRLDMAFPSVTSPFVKLSVKISNLQQQLEKAKHTENELWTRVVSPRCTN